MDVPARRELQKSSQEPTIAAAKVLEASVVREGKEHECDAAHECGKNMPCMFQTPAYQRTLLSQSQWRRNHGVSGVSGPPTFWSAGSSGVRIYFRYLDRWIL